MNITEDECAECGSTLVQVRPGKWQCPKCEIDNMLKQAHRQGWEQAKRAAARIAKQTDFPPSPKSYYTLGRADAAKAIAAMEYKEAEDE